MIDILSSVPLTPSGIKLKSSFPTARWAVLKGQCALPVTCRSPLYEKLRRTKRKGRNWCQSYSQTKFIWNVLSLWVIRLYLPGQQGVEIVWCGRVGAQRRRGDVGCCLGPVLAPVVWTVCSQASSNGLSIDHSACKSSAIKTGGTTTLLEL